MRRVYLVDNELWALVFLRSALDWGAYGFEVAGEFTNSVTALERIVADKPEVVFTDIRMPELSGLELMQRAKQAGFTGQFVILSGFAEFAYAQEAVRLGAFDYCLKPITDKDGSALLERLQKTLDSAEKIQAVPPEAETEEAEDSRTFDRLLAYIQEHYSEKLRLKDVAAHFYLSPGYCSVLFSKRVGTSFPEYITQLRINRACTLLRATDLSIEEIAARVGIDDYFYFSKVFKKTIGVTPRQYRVSKGDTP